MFRHKIEKLKKKTSILSPKSIFLRNVEKSTALLRTENYHLLKHSLKLRYYKADTVRKSDSAALNYPDKRKKLSN